MAKPKSRTAIYHPPKPGMPYLVVTVTPDGVSALPAPSKDEARTMALEKAREAADEAQ
jgi:hypothetical protein